MTPKWADFSKDGDILIDWEQAIENAIAFDAGSRDKDASLGKMLVSIQRMAFECGYEAGINNKHPDGRMLIFTGGNA